MIQCLINVIMQTGIPVTILYLVGIHMLISCTMLLGKASKHGWMLDKPKHGFVFDEMKRSRASFKYGLRFLKRHTNQEIGNLLAAKLQAGRTDRFWKEVGRKNNCKVPLPNCIDGISGADNIPGVVSLNY